MRRIMIIEDDIYLREELIHMFERVGYSVSGISSFDSPEKEILEYHPDLAVMDLNLPGKSGFELCKSLKARASFPILILTASDKLSDELCALGLGADDFITKPCHQERLIAHVERLLHTYEKVRSLLQAGELIFDTDTYKIIWRSAHIVLPETEGKILQALIEHYPNVVLKQDLALVLWGGYEYVDENILQVNMARLRRNLSAIGLAGAIQTERGQGYRLEVDRL